MTPMTEPRSHPDWRPLALGLVLLTAVYAIFYRLVPFEFRGYLLFPFGGWALYSGARLTTRVALPLIFGVFALTDVLLYTTKGGVPPNYVFYVCLAASILIGRALLAHSQAPWRVGVGAVAAYAFFFLVTNFVAWLEPARPYYQPHTFASLMLAYKEGLEFVRMQPGHIVGDLVFSFGLFGAHAVLAPAYFPAEKVAMEGVR
jgi:Family of unknown function (DUF6580)